MSIKSHFLYQEPERSQIEWKKESIDAKTNMTELLELSDKDFKAVMKRMLQ